MTRKFLRDMREVDNMLHKALARYRKSKELRVPPGQGMLIGFLMKNAGKEIFQKDIEAEFAIARSTVTATLDSMERKGYITREAVVRDARLKKISLTPKAVESHNRIIADLEQLETIMFTGVSCEEAETLFHVMDKIKANLSNLYSKGGKSDGNQDNR